MLKHESQVMPLVHHLFVSAFFALLLITVTTSFSDYEASDDPPGVSASICTFRGRRLKEYTLLFYHQPPNQNLEMIKFII